MSRLMAIIQCPGQRSSASAEICFINSSVILNLNFAIRFTFCYNVKWVYGIGMLVRFVTQGGGCSNHSPHFCFVKALSLHRSFLSLKHELLSTASTCYFNHFPPIGRSRDEANNFLLATLWTCAYPLSKRLSPIL